MSPRMGWAAHGVVSASQLRALGIPESTVRGRVAAGRMWLRYRGVWSVIPPAMLKDEGRWLAAVLRCGGLPDVTGDVALSHDAAGALHGLRASPRIDVTIAGRRRIRAPGINTHCSTTLRPQDITVVRRVPVTTVARTTLDLAEGLTRSQLERVLEESEVLGVLDEPALYEQIAANIHRTAATKLKALLDHYQVDHGAVRNEFEALMRARLRAGGAPEPFANVPIDLHDGGQPITPDFHWPTERVVLQVDGWKFHRSRQKRERDTRTDQRCLAAGWQPIRATWLQLRDEAPRIVGTVLGQLAARSIDRAA